MFLHQKLDYELVFITSEVKDSSAMEMEKRFNAMNVSEMFFDTETTGLNVITDYPFLIQLVFGKIIYVFEPTTELMETTLRLMRKTDRVWGANVKFDIHMLKNINCDVSGINFADIQAVARLTQYADDHDSISLEVLGVKYVDPTAKQGAKIIKQRLAELNRLNKNYAKERYLEHFSKEIKKYEAPAFGKLFAEYQSRIPYVTHVYDEYFDFLDQYYQPANYYSVYLAYPDLMLNYAADDVVVTREYLHKAMPVVIQTNPGLVTLEREHQLLIPIVEMERIGMKVDLDYLLESRAKVMNYRSGLYTELEELTGVKFTVAQPKVITQIFASQFKIYLTSTDEDALTAVMVDDSKPTAQKVASIILELRSIDRILGTYIDGKLKGIVNGRIYTTIHNQGTVTGRVSSDLQQQPKEALTDKEGNEVFHPRKAFLADEGWNLIFMDFSQMELRVQAYYTLLLKEGDLNLCRAYIPLNCRSTVTGELYDYKDPECVKRWNSGEWVHNEDGVVWEPIDLHAVTTFKAFPFLNNDPNHPEFKHYRTIGKRCNFLKNYQGGINAIISKLKVSKETAELLDKAYYDSFPGIKQYQRWVNSELLLKGYVTNLMGRRYYLRNANWFYKASNYLIQGSCADYIKEKIIQCYNYIEQHQWNTKFLMQVHDELIFLVPDSELPYVIEPLQAILQDSDDIMPYIPMLADVEKSVTNWADKFEM